MDVNSEAVLAACPFCGGEYAQVVCGVADWPSVVCSTHGNGCGASTGLCSSGSDADAIAAWNRRATPASDEAVGDARVRAGYEAYWREPHVDPNERIRRAIDAADLVRAPDPAGKGAFTDEMQGAMHRVVLRAGGYTNGLLPAMFTAALAARTAPPVQGDDDEEGGIDRWRLYLGERNRMERDAFGPWVRYDDHIARLAPIAPDARSVDGLTLPERQALNRVELSLDDSREHDDYATVCAALRRLAGAKVQSENPKETSP